MACTTYHFAKPARGRSHCLRPKLVTQLQRYDPDGRLQEVLELVSANWWAARASPQMRTFLKHHAPSPRLFFCREAAAGLCGSIIIGPGARVERPGRGGAGATLYCGPALSMVFLQNGESLYRLVGSSGSLVSAAWSWARRIHAPEVEFELTVGGDHVVLASLSRRCIQIMPQCALPEPAADMVLLSGVWLARSLGWIG